MENDGIRLSFQNLPAEIMLMVIEVVPDLASLYSLVFASAWALQVFKNGSTRVINRVVDKMPSHLRRYPWWIAIISSLQSKRSPYTLEDPTLQSFIRRHEDLHALLSLDAIADNESMFPRLREDLFGTPGPLRLLTAARLVELLAPGCLSRAIALLSELEPG
ncbi:hypothetical protein VUR80DRAFT_3858 [Thermomyces stellatus]